MRKISSYTFINITLLLVLLLILAGYFQSISKEKRLKEEIKNHEWPANATLAAFVAAGLLN